MTTVRSYFPLNYRWIVVAAALLLVGFISQTEVARLQAAPVADPGPVVQTHHETIPNPVYGSAQRVVAGCKGVATPCAWEAASTWTTGAVPDGSSRVIVDGVVRIGGETAVSHSIGIYPGGQLSFAPNANTRLQTADIVVFEGGNLEIGRVAQPIADDKTAEIIIRDLPFSPDDTKQHLRGIVVVNGTFYAHGRGVWEAFIRTAAEPAAGSKNIALSTSAQAANWHVGDELVLPTSSQCPISANEGTCPIETEDRTIAAIAPDGMSLTLNQPLQFDHPGARDRNGHIDFLPHLVNKSRNIVIRSENPNGVRGHVLLHGRSTIDIRYVRFQDLGRTDIRDLGDDNQKGRYPLHAHHLIGPVTPLPNGYQFMIYGNVVDFGPENREQDRKWGITIHGSHFGLIEQNIVDYASGAAIVTEDASETGNEFLYNFVVRVVGGNGERFEDQDVSDGSKLGRAGIAYWFNGGGGNVYRHNVAAAVEECIYCYGFKFDNVYNGDVMIPTAQGADPHMGGGIMVDSYTIGLTDFANNEAYAVPNGITIWWVCAEFETPREGCSSLMKDFVVWHHHRWGYFGYETNAMTIDGFIHRGDVTRLENEYELVTSLYLVDYFQRQTVIRNADLQGAMLGIEMPVNRDVRGSDGDNVGITRVENSLIVASTGMLISSPSSTNGADDLPPQRTILRNVQFAYPPQRQNKFISINGNGAEAATSNNPNARNDIWIIDYNKPAGEDGPDLYISPRYQPKSRCDNALGDCSNEISGSFPAIEGGYIYPLADNLIPPPVGSHKVYLPVVVKW
ncbi:MAG: G8 domain-containing protein [Chloroflexota bacterium]